MARILVVDDEHNIRLMVGLALRHVGHTVETAPDGTEAIERFGNGSEWDLVLLDQRLPDMQGLDVLALMRQTDPSCRVVVITAYGTVELARQAVERGALDLLRKPFTTDMLRGVVAAALSEDPRAPRPLIAVNGYAVSSNVDCDETHGHVLLRFRVRRPAGDVEVAAVEVPDAVAEQAHAYAGLRTPDIDRDRALVICRLVGEELLANYLWQNADLPANGLLRADELNMATRRRLDAVLSGARSEAIARCGSASGSPFGGRS